MATEKFYGKISHEAGTAATDGATKGQVDAAEANAKNRAAHTGTQLASTISDFQAAVDARVQTVVGAAPGALDTLAELASALGNDANYAATTTTALGGLNTRVTALEGASGAPTSYTLAAGASSVVTHNKGRRVLAQVVEVASGQIVHPVVTGNGVGNTITVDFGATAIGANSHVVLIY